MHTSEEFAFFKSTMPKSRKADYYLGCLEGSVFIDFDKTDENQISLRRISFDGYGCCNIAQSQRTPLSISDSQKFISELDKVELDQEIITALIKRILELNKSNIWIDALEEYNLI